MDTNKKRAHKIVVVGSSKFTDRGFVFGFLDQMQEMLKSPGFESPIETVYSSNFSGVSMYAKEWCQFNKVQFKEHHFFSTEKTNPFFEQEEIPQVVLQNDPYYQNGKDFFMAEHINMLVLMPNPNGELGAQTLNIERMAKAASIDILNAQDLYKNVLSVRAKETPKVKEGVNNLSSLGKI